MREVPALQPEHWMRMDEQCLQPCGTRCRERGAELIRAPSDEELDLQTQACGFTLDRAMLLVTRAATLLSVGRASLSS
ncbi:MAG TPA: hypothetical protein VID04_11120 [Methylomirabilota bacterium]|jgi:hypothetical protein